MKKSNKATIQLNQATINAIAKAVFKEMNKPRRIIVDTRFIPLKALHKS